MGVGKRLKMRTREKNDWRQVPGGGGRVLGAQGDGGPLFQVFGTGGQVSLSHRLDSVFNKKSVWRQMK